MDLPKKFNISPTFNVADLKKYYSDEDSSQQLRTIASEVEVLDI